MVDNSGKPSKLVANFASRWRAFARHAFDDYRPELHYMRGPGPKWREKHLSASAAKSAPSPAAAEARVYSL